MHFLIYSSAPSGFYLQIFCPVKTVLREFFSTVYLCRGKDKEIIKRTIKVFNFVVVFSFFLFDKKACYIDLLDLKKLLYIYAFHNKLYKKILQHILAVVLCGLFLILL